VREGGRAIGARRPAARRPQPQARPEPPPLRPLLLAARFAVAYLALLAALWAARPLLLPLVGRIARDLLVLASAVPPIWDIRWQQGWAFSVITPLSPDPHPGAAPWTGFALVFPLAFALSAPGLGGRARLARVLNITVGGLLLFGLLVACNAAHTLEQTLQHQGLLLFPYWRAWVHFQVSFWSWSLAAIIYPVGASLYALGPLLPGIAPRTAPAPAAPSAGTPTWRAALGWAALVAALALADRVAAARLRALDLGSVATAVEPWNRDPGRYYVELAERLLAAGDRAAARRFLEVAVRYPPHAARAARGLDQLIGPGQARGER
jgi:hypothetical protein